jgi:hypothetical protein
LSEFFFGVEAVQEFFLKGFIPTFFSVYRQKLSTINEPLNVSICGTTISQTTCEKLLGVHMDDSLTWNTHISHVIKKYNNKLELVKRAKPYLTPKLLLLLYNSIAKPTLEYCCSV